MLDFLSCCHPGFPERVASKINQCAKRNSLRVAYHRPPDTTIQVLGLCMLDRDAAVCIKIPPRAHYPVAVSYLHGWTWTLRSCEYSRNSWSCRRKGCTRDPPGRIAENGV
jgi:hypothetical protein